MAKLQPRTVIQVSRIAADEAMAQLESHIDAHPLRFGRDHSDEMFKELRDRLEIGFSKTLAELEIPPR